jgi:hypothetical protein
LLRKIQKMFSGKHRQEKWGVSVETLSNNEEDPAECLHHFGYLANRDKETPIPQECISCPKVLKCIELNLT